jgi:adenylyltransferase/sulfurtransferase
LAGCSTPAPTTTTLPEQEQEDEITPRQLADRLERGERPYILDVRNAYEADIAALPYANKTIPVEVLDQRLDELERVRDQEIIVYCRSGRRSTEAVRLLKAAGFAKAKNLDGGILRWSDEVDPSVSKY